MSAWRRVALEYLPEYHRKIADAPNVMSMWIELTFEFEDLYSELKKTGVLNDDCVKRFYQCADWCLSTAQTSGKATNVSSAVCCAFYEHIIMKDKIRDDLHRWLSPRHLDQLAGVFTYHLPVAEYDVFAAKFLERYKRLRPSRKSS